MGELQVVFIFMAVLYFLFCCIIMCAETHRCTPQKTSIKELHASLYSFFLHIL